jgi:hypothetical protein
MMGMGMPMGGFSPYQSQYSSPISPGAARWHAGGSDSGAGAGIGKGKGKEVVRETEAASGGAESERDAIEMSQMMPGQHLGFSPMSMAIPTQAAPIIRPPVPMYMRESPDSAASRYGDGTEAHAEAEHQVEGGAKAEAEEGAVDGMGIAF